MGRPATFRGMGKGMSESRNSKTCAESAQIDLFSTDTLPPYTEKVARLPAGFFLGRCGLDVVENPRAKYRRVRPLAASRSAMPSVRTLLHDRFVLYERLERRAKRDQRDNSKRLR